MLNFSPEIDRHLPVLFTVRTAPPAGQLLLFQQAPPLFGRLGRRHGRLRSDDGGLDSNLRLQLRHRFQQMDCRRAAIAAMQGVIVMLREYRYFRATDPA